MTREKRVISSSRSMTFDELCRIAKATPEERDQAAWFLATLRAKKTYEALKAE